MIGAGGYGQIYYSLDIRHNDHVAVKVEPTRRNGKVVRRMILEQKVLLRLQGRPHAALMYGSGVEHDLNYIVLQLLSVNLGDLRKQCPFKRFSKSTAGRIMQQVSGRVYSVIALPCDVKYRLEFLIASYQKFLFDPGFMFGSVYFRFQFRFFDSNSGIDSIKESTGFENRMKESVKESELRIDWEARNRNRKGSIKVESGVHWFPYS